jgi:GntR family transcriptional regulator / MocR family aminotransferase
MKRVPSGILPVVSVDRNAALALHRQIYDWFRAAILDGRLHPGQRIPSTRVLASEIGVSRFPVLSAYGQLLAEGYIESQVGAGTVVCASMPEQLMSSRLERTNAASVRSGPRRVADRCRLLPRRQAIPWMMHRGAFRVGQIAFDQFPHQIWLSLLTRRGRAVNAEALHYGDPKGSPALRQAIANYLRVARSVRCDAEQVLVVNGSQQALEISARVLLNPGDRVWVEDPSYRLARDVFTLNGCRMVPIPVDGEGLYVSVGTKICRAARAVFVTPSHQFPLGVTMSASRRLQLVDWAQNSGSWILEDDYDSEFRYESQPIASLQGLDPNSRVVYIGTFSKVLFPSLRLGYLVVPPDLIDRFHIMRRVMDLGLPTLSQEVLADFIDEGHYVRHIRRMRVHYGENRRVLTESLAKTFGQKLQLIGDEAGMHLTVMLPNGYSDEEISRRAVREGLSLWPLSRLYMKNPRQGFTLGFGGVTAKQIPHAVRKLHNLLSPKIAERRHDRIQK